MRFIRGRFPGIVEGIDCRDFEDVYARELLLALFEHRVLVIHGQQLEAAQFAQFVRMLGATISHPLRQFRVNGLSDVISISNLYDREGRPVGIHEGGAYWHTDMSYLKIRGVLTALYSVRVPQVGGETEFIDCVGALQTLRAEVERGGAPASVEWLLRSRADIVHRFGNRERWRNADARRQSITNAQSGSLPKDVVHPLIMRHPVTGRESLYAVAGTSILVSGLSPEESYEALDWIFDFIRMTGPRYRHTYACGDVVIWDNASTMHCGPEIGPSDDEENCRLLLRANAHYGASQSNV
jgi:taurine dioxygenase